MTFYPIMGIKYNSSISSEVTLIEGRQWIDWLNYGVRFLIEWNKTRDLLSMLPFTLGLKFINCEL